MTGKQSRGTCNYCEKDYAKGGMTRHLAACEKRKIASSEVMGSGKGKIRTATIYHIRVECPYLPMYWMYIEIPADLTLAVLDQFLRDIWLECCGHLSAFYIGGRTYHSYPELAQDYGEKTMSVQIANALKPGMDFRHEYDFGTTTELALKVISQREGQARGTVVQIMARNDPPVLPCEVCGEPSVAVCPMCMYEGKGWVCEKHAPKHKCGEEMLLPVVNSPRTGECGYTG